MYEVDIRLTHRALGRLSRKEYMSNSIRCKMSGYDSDDILCQALDLFEEQEAAKIFLTQNTFRDIPEAEKENILDVLDSAVDITDMLDVGGASEIAGQRQMENKRKFVEDKKVYPGNSSRFTLVDPGQLENMSKPIVPPNTPRKTQWAVNLYTDWVTEMLHVREDPSVVNILEKESDLLKLSTENMNNVLSSFVLAIRKQDGSSYRSGSLFSVITALQKHLKVNGCPISLLNDPQFNKLKTCLDNAMQCVTRQGIGLEKKQANVITKAEESELWHKGILGTETPTALLHTIFWTVGVNFGLRGGEEHRNLTLDNFKIRNDEGGMRYLEYCESCQRLSRVE